MLWKIATDVLEVKQWQIFATIDYKSSMHTGFFIYLNDIIAVVINALRKRKLANY